MPDSSLDLVWQPAWPAPVRTMLAQHRRGQGDPTWALDGETVWRAVRTPEGPATLRVAPLDPEGEVRAAAWGPGARWALDSVPGLLGGLDDLSGFEPTGEALLAAVRRLPHWRLGRSGVLWEALAPSILEQKVTSQEAFGGFRRMVQRFGDQAPGPGAELGLRLQPSPARVRRIASWEWLQCGVDGARSATMVRAATVAESLQRRLEVDPAELDAALRSVPGIGVWTSAEVRSRAAGDADAVSFGDYHLASQVGWAVARTDFTDAQLAEHLEPWRPHRGRVATLLRIAGPHRPRHGPRMAPRTHLPVRGR
ncbi:DNA-3-methyladenine glycosylase family protein [Nocardioides gilvus]|uniref:DNA-3-methyladenine glycosylase family protein n=1 Tax=Nocardioides gilvus TaxID=1735589 RepID=UPI000D7491B5|nr:DNA-3-methyladenine glycosylase 2 family protein [Nocardioides gilvus]